MRDSRFAPAWAASGAGGPNAGGVKPLCPQDSEYLIRMTSLKQFIFEK